MTLIFRGDLDHTRVLDEFIYDLFWVYLKRDKVCVTFSTISKWILLPRKAQKLLQQRDAVHRLEVAQDIWISWVQAFPPSLFYSFIKQI